MIQKLDLNENLINKINYSLSFSLNNEILSVERVSYEPLWRKIVFTGLFVIPTTCFLLTTLYCIYAIIVDAQYANHCSEALPFLILITLICFSSFLWFGLNWKTCTSRSTNRLSVSSSFLCYLLLRPSSIKLEPDFYRLKAIKVMWLGKLI